MTKNLTFQKSKYWIANWLWEEKQKSISKENRKDVAKQWMFSFSSRDRFLKRALCNESKKHLTQSGKY